MGQSKQVKEFRNFTGGLVTDGPLLSRPDNTTTDESNFKLNKDGTRTKRDLVYADNSYSDVFAASQGSETPNDVATNSFIWESAGGIVGNDRVVVQIGNKVFLSKASETIPERLHITFPSLTSDYSTPLSFASISGKLIVATGQGEPYLVTLSASDTISVEKIPIRVRDNFGEQDLNSSYSGFFLPLDDLLSEGFLDERPTTMTKAHEYNLRNQGWGTKRTSYTTGRLEHDPIRLFNTDSGVYPSNADDVVSWLKTNPNAGANSFLVRFDGVSLAANSPTNSRAPYGSFVINLLSRGQSRATELAKNNTKQGFTTFAGSLSTDLSGGGPRLVEEFAGRVWYAGFSDEVTDGTNHTPTLSSMLAYSQSVERVSQVGKCFQEGDPTHEDMPDLVDTDGGFIKIAGVSDIVRIVAIDDALVVLARNGVWAISGGENLFTANNQLVYKVSDDGVVQPNSVVKVGNDLYFMSGLAIHQVTRGQSGRLSCVKISDKVSTYLSDWQPSSYSGLSGIYDEFENVVKWMFDNPLAQISDTYEIVYNLNFDAFTLNYYVGGYSSTSKAIIDYVPIPSVSTYDSSEGVTDGGVAVTDSAVEVTTSVTTVQRSPARHRYLANVATLTSTASLQTFATTSSSTNTLYDFEDSDYVVYPYMYTAPLTLPESSRRKACPYVVFHMGLYRDIDNEGGSSPGSSCLVRPIWNFNTKVAGSFEVYKNKKGLLNSNMVLQSRSKVRGRGRELSFLIWTQQALPLKIHGWGLDIDTNDRL